MFDKGDLRKIRFILCTLLFFLAVGFYVNRGIVIKGLYMDDLYTWSCYGEQSIWEFVFPIGTSERFRPVFWGALYLMMKIVGTHVNWFVPFNIVINALVACGISFLAFRLSKKNMVATFGSGLMYIVSRFAYFQIAQAMNGLMETMALALALVVLYELLKFVRPALDFSMEDLPPKDRAEICFKQNRLLSHHFYCALMVWFLLVFTHERYLGLFPLFYLALAIKLIGYREKSFNKNARSAYRPHLLDWFIPAILLIIILIIRIYAIGTALPAGTGGTYVEETFNLSEAISYAFDQILYIFGVNAGPEYLCGIEWGDTSYVIKCAVAISVVFIGMCVVVFAVEFIRDLEKMHSCDLGKSTPQSLRLKLNDRIICSVMFLSFIALCIGDSSVTIRLEMRWIYVSYAAALLFASYMLGCLKPVYTETSPRRDSLAVRFLDIFPVSGPGAIATFSFVIYLVFSVYTNIYYRQYFPNLYFWTDQFRMNSLAEETVEKYGTDFLSGKNIYIIGNSYGMSDFYADTFFKPYFPVDSSDEVTVMFLESEEEVPADEVVEDAALVLREVPEDDAYEDITDRFKSIVG